MKKNRGFTLIELLAVIVILGILLSISTVSVNTLRKKQEEKNRKNIISSILTGAKEYNAEKQIEIGDNVSVSTLISDNYTDFDTNKYPDLISKEVTKTQCLNNKLKIKYYIKIDDSTTYNDCGCEEQKNIGTSKQLCTD